MTTIVLAQLITQADGGRAKILLQTPIVQEAHFPIPMKFDYRYMYDGRVLFKYSRSPKLSLTSEKGESLHVGAGVISFQFQTRTDVGSHIRAFEVLS